ncbi:glycosyltransferase family 39 protein, partial [Candidatus Micrarchaeota archaeon]|nr:glycosyltransferase family 39 protein [Candidatus Micrarchaeota archaeon]
SYSYTAFAKGLANFDFILEKGEAKEMANVRTPGYPLFLGIMYFFGLTDGLISIVQVLLEGVSIYLMYLLAKTIFKEEKVALVAAFLYAISPMFISFSFKLVSESFFAFVLLFANLLFFRYLIERKEKNLIYAALVFGFLIMVRPITIGFPIVYALVLLWQKKPIKEVGMFLIFSYIFTGFWILRNFYVLNELTFSSISTISYVCWTGPVIVTDKDADVSKWKNEIEEFGLDFPDKCAAKLNKSNMQRAQKVYNELISAYPDIYLKSNLKSAVLLFSPQTPNYVLESFGMETPHLAYVIFQKGLDPNAVFNEISKSGLYFVLLVVFIIYQIFVYLSSARAILAKQKTDQVLLALLVVIILYLIVVHGPQLLFSGYRYRIPIEPFIILFAARGVFYLVEDLRKRGILK